MFHRLHNHRAFAAIACFAAFLCGMLPARVSATATIDDDARILALLDGQTCAARLHMSRMVAQELATPAPSPTETPGASPVASPEVIPGVSPTPSPLPTPVFGRAQTGAATLSPTPRPASVTPPPVPTPTPTINPSTQDVFLVRGGPTPPPVTPAGHPIPQPTAVPTGAATLAPSSVAVMADKVNFNSNQGHPGDATGNVHIFYNSGGGGTNAGEVVGDHAHYDGIRTVTITGHPFLVDKTHDTVFTADEIDFDVIDQSAKLIGGHGISSQGVDRGLIHFASPDLHTDAEGIGHGTNPSLSTCENPRGGYHVTGKKMTVYPGDRIVINDAILWLGAAAVFFLPRVVIPLRSVENQVTRPQYFPVVGYDEFEGAYIKALLGFGHDQYYYGYYRVEYFTKVGLGLGYVGFFAKRNGRRSGNINYYGIHDKRVGTSTHNFQAQEQENFSQTLRGLFQLSYQGNYGPLTNVPVSTNITAEVAHNTLHSQQQYSFTRAAVGSQSNSDSFAFTDSNQIGLNLTQQENVSFSDSSSNYGGVSSFNSTTHATTLTNYNTSGANYQLTFDKTFTQEPFGGIDKLPELQIRPNYFFRHFVFPLSATFTAGDYDQPASGQYDNLSTTRADMAFVLGPALFNVFGSNFSASVNVNQYAYGTGDLKASIQQILALNTPIGNHFVNSISYNEANYNGPALVPFQYLDLQPTENTKNAQDLMRFYNGNIYNFTLGFATNFNGIAQPVTYQLNAQPSTRSLVMLGGSYNPGPGLGFTPTQVQFATPFGYETTLQFAGTIDWQNHERIENKNIFLSKIIGECYQIQLDYIEASHLVNVQVNLLAFPSRSAAFGIGQGGSIIPSSLNF